MKQLYIIFLLLSCISVRAADWFVYNSINDRIIGGSSYTRYTWDANRLNISSSHEYPVSTNTQPDYSQGGTVLAFLGPTAPETPTRFEHTNGIHVGYTFDTGDRIQSTNSATKGTYVLVAGTNTIANVYVQGDGTQYVNGVVAAWPTSNFYTVEADNVTNGTGTAFSLYKDIMYDTFIGFNAISNLTKYIRCGQDNEPEILGGLGMTQTDFDNWDGWYQGVERYYSFNHEGQFANNPVQDFSKNEAHGQPKATGLTTIGTTNNGIAMFIANTYLETPTLFSGATQSTFSAMMFWDSLSDLMVVFDQRTGVNDRDALETSFAGGQGNNDFIALVRDGNVAYIETTGDYITTGAWHHVVRVYDRGDLKIYFNNVLCTVITNDPPIATASDVNSAVLKVGDSLETSRQNFRGRMDMVRFTLNVASEATRQDWYDEGTNAVASGDLN